MREELGSIGPVWFLGCQYLNTSTCHFSMFYEARDEQKLLQINANTAQLQSELWSATHAPAALQPTPVVALAISGMNDVLNSQGYTQAAWWNRIPLAAWAMM